MKTIEEWRKIFGMEYDDDNDGKRTLQAIRNEAIDACIEAIKDKIEKTNPGAIIWLAGLWQGIYEIEDMKKEINELGKY